MAAAGDGTGTCGFAIEVGEQATHGDFEAFKQAIKAKSKLDLATLGKHVVEYSGVSGDRVTMKFNPSGRPTVWRNGKERPWTTDTGQYVPVSGGDAPIRSTWKSGKLRVEAGGRTFDATFTENGDYTFRNRD